MYDKDLIDLYKLKRKKYGNVDDYSKTLNNIFGENKYNLTVDLDSVPRLA